MCGQIMEKFFCGETAAEIWANIEEKERHNFYPSSFCASAKVSSLRREGPSLVCRREQILIRYWRCYIIIHQTIPTPHRHMHLLLHSVSVRRIFVPKVIFTRFSKSKYSIPQTTNFNLNCFLIFLNFFVLNSCTFGVKFPGLKVFEV